MAETIISGATAGATASIISWLVIKKIKENQESGEKIDEIEAVIQGGEEWFDTGIIEVLEEHDEELQSMSKKLEELEEQAVELNDRISRIKARVDMLVKRSEQRKSERGEEKDG